MDILTLLSLIAAPAKVTIGLEVLLEVSFRDCNLLLRGDTALASLIGFAEDGVYSGDSNRLHG